MDIFIQEFPSMVSADVCERMIAKFDHYERSPVGELKVLDKFASDGGGPTNREPRKRNVST